MKATKLHKITNREREKKEREREITILIATELLLAWLALLQVLSRARCLLSLQVSAACSRRGGDRTLPCLGLAPSPQVLQVSFVWFGKLPPAVPTAKKRKELLLSFFLVVLFQHYYSCSFPIYIYYFFSLACFRSVSYREREQKRREKALGFLEHE